MKKLYKILVLQAVIIVLLAGTLAYGYTGNIPFTISSGVYPQADYTVYFEGSTYYAKNIHGVIDSDGTNATTVIQYALTNGKETFITQGTYPIDRNVLEIPSDHYLHGMGSSSILQLKTYADAGSVETILLENSENATGNDNIIIENLAFDGNDQPTTFTSGYPIGIYFRNVVNFTLRNLFMYHELMNGIRIGEAFGMYGDVGCQYGLIDNCHFTNGIGIDGYGGAIYILDDSEYITVQNCKVINANRTIMLEGNSGHLVENIVISNNYIFNVSYMYGLGGRYLANVLFENNIIDSQGDRDGLPLDHGYNITIKGLILCNSVSEGIKVYNNSTHVRIIGTEIYDHASHGVQIWDSKWIILESSIICGNGGYGCRIGGTSDYVAVGYCIFDNNTSGDAVSDASGGTNYFHDYWNGASWVA